MMRRIPWTRIKDGFDGALRIALALVFVVAATVYLAGPRSELALRKIAEEEAAELAAATPSRAAQAPAAPPPAAAGAPSDASPTTAAGRNVTPPSITAPVTLDGTAGLTRVAPREPLTPTETGTAEADGESEIRLRLLPRPIAIDTATFLVQRGKVKLSGVQPIAPSRECGEGGASWPCGMQARTALRLWLRARSIRCDVPENFGRTDETIDAECSLGPQDIGQWLVENGWAEARPDGRYTAVEAKAREAGRGIWGDGRTAPPPDTQ